METIYIPIIGFIVVIFFIVAMTSNINSSLEILAVIIVFSVVNYIYTWQKNEKKMTKIDNREFGRDGGELMCHEAFGGTFYVSKKRGWTFDSGHAVKEDRAIGYSDCVRNGGGK